METGKNSEQQYEFAMLFFAQGREERGWVSRKPRAQQTRRLSSHSVTSNYKLLRLALLSRFHVSACWLVVCSSSSAPACGFSTAQKNPCWAPGHEKGAWRLVDLPRSPAYEGVRVQVTGCLGHRRARRAWHGMGM